jgi:hypothetical protein
MGFSVWILEAGGKTKAFKAALASIGRNKDRVLATYGRLQDLPKSLEAISSEMAKDISTIPWEELRAGQIQKLRGMCLGADELLLATDSDLEGELIAYQIRQCLGGTLIPMHRVSLQGISADHLAKAYAGKTDINMNRVQAAISRRLFDRHLGYQLNDADDHYAQSMGRVISPLIQSLAQRPPVNTRIECDLNDGWKAIFRLPNHLSVHAEALCGMLSTLPTVTPVKTSVEKRVREKRPLIGPEAVLLCADQLNLPVKTIIDGMQENYMEGRLSYPRTDSRRLGEIAQKWALRLAQKSQTPFNQSLLVERSQVLDDRAFDAHEGLMPMTDDLVGKSPRTNYLSDKDKVLAVITKHSCEIGNKAQHYVLESGRFADDSDSMKWRKITAAYSRYLTLERCQEEHAVMPCGSLDKIEREPSYAEGRIRLWRDTPDLVAARRLVEIGLGRPSTLGIIAEKAATKYLTEFGVLNKNAHLMLYKVNERCPALLRDGIARRVEHQLLDTERTLSVAQRLSHAWGILRGKPVVDENEAAQPLPAPSPVELPAMEPDQVTGEASRTVRTSAKPSDGGRLPSFGD